MGGAAGDQLLLITFVVSPRNPASAQVSGYGMIHAVIEETGADSQWMGD